MESSNEDRNLPPLLLLKERIIKVEVLIGKYAQLSRKYSDLEKAFNESVENEKKAKKDAIRYLEKYCKLSKKCDTLEKTIKSLEELLKDKNDAVEEYKNELERARCLVETCTLERNLNQESEKDRDFLVTSLWKVLKKSESNRNRILTSAFFKRFENDLERLKLEDFRVNKQRRIIARKENSTREAADETDAASFSPTFRSIESVDSGFVENDSSPDISKSLLEDESEKECRDAEITAGTLSDRSKTRRANANDVSYLHCEELDRRSASPGVSEGASSAIFANADELAERGSCIKNFTKSNDSLEKVCGALPILSSSSELGFDEENERNGFEYAVNKSWLPCRKYRGKMKKALPRLDFNFRNVLNSNPSDNIDYPAGTSSETITPDTDIVIGDLKIAEESSYQCIMASYRVKDNPGVGNRENDDVGDNHEASIGRDYGSARITKRPLNSVKSIFDPPVDEHVSHGERESNIRCEELNFAACKRTPKINLVNAGKGAEEEVQKFEDDGGNRSAVDVSVESNRNNVLHGERESNIRCEELNFAACKRTPKINLVNAGGGAEEVRKLEDGGGNRSAVDVFVESNRNTITNKSKKLAGLADGSGTWTPDEDVTRILERVATARLLSPIKDCVKSGKAIRSSSGDLVKGRDLHDRGKRETEKPVESREGRGFALSIGKLTEHKTVQTEVETKEREIPSLGDKGDRKGSQKLSKKMRDRRMMKRARVLDRFMKAWKFQPFCFDFMAMMLSFAEARRSPCPMRGELFTRMKRKRPSEESVGELRRKRMRKSQSWDVEYVKESKDAVLENEKRRDFSGEKSDEGSDTCESRGRLASAKDPEQKMDKELEGCKLESNGDIPLEIVKSFSYSREELFPFENHGAVEAVVADMGFKVEDRCHDWNAAAFSGAARRMEPMTEAVVESEDGLSVTEKPDKGVITDAASKNKIFKDGFSDYKCGNVDYGGAVLLTSLDGTRKRTEYCGTPLGKEANELQGRFNGGGDESEAMATEETLHRGKESPPRGKSSETHLRNRRRIEHNMKSAPKTASDLIPSLQRGKRFRIDGEKNEVPDLGAEHNMEVNETTKKVGEDSPGASLLDSIMSAMTRQAEEFAIKLPNRGENVLQQLPQQVAQCSAVAETGMLAKGPDCDRKPRNRSTLSEDAKIKKLVSVELRKFLKAELRTTEEAEEKIKPCISVLDKAREEVVASVIVAEVMTNVDEAVEEYERPAPPLTRTQHRLMSVLAILGSPWERFERISYRILKVIRSKLFPENFFWPDDSLEMATCFYAALCKKLNDFKVIRKFCFASMVAMKQRWPIAVLAVLQIWPDILHDAAESQNNILVETFVNLILHAPKTENNLRRRQQGKLLALKHLMMNFYHYEVKLTIEEFARKLLESLADGTCGASSALILMTRVRDWTWTKKHIMPKLLELLTAWSERKLGDGVGTKVLDIIEKMKQVFPVSSPSSVEDVSSHLSRLLHSKALNEAAEARMIKVLCSLRHHSGVTDILQGHLESFAGNEALCKRIRSAIASANRKGRPMIRESVGRQWGRSKAPMKGGRMVKRKKKKKKKKKKKLKTSSDPQNNALQPEDSPFTHY